MMRVMMRRIVAVALALGLAGAWVLSASAAQRREDQKRDRLSREQRQEVQAVVKLLDEVLKGQPPPSDFAIGWHNDFLKAQEGRTYVPFTLTLEPGAMTTPSASLYLRVVDRNQAAKKEETEKERERKEVLYAFEDVYFVDLKPSEDGKIRLSRAFAVPGGEYDVFVLLREWSEKRARDAKPKTALLKQPLTIPNFYTSELTTSTIILADRVEPLSAPLPPEQQAENPYTLGTTRIVPALDTKFTKKEELNIIFLVYNPQVKGTKPDVTVEYNFHQVLPEGEKYFNRTNPQQFNAQTLPPQFDLTAGHQLVAGQSVPLASFPEGEYRLEIKITDNAAGKSITRDVRFSVAGA
jgi:hypothetical protein